MANSKSGVVLAVGQPQQQYQQPTQTTYQPPQVEDDRPFL